MQGRRKWGGQGEHVPSIFLTGGYRPPPNFDISSLLSKMNDISAVKPVDERDKLPFQTMSVPQPNSFPESTRIRDIDSDRFSVSSDISSDSESVTTKSINISIPSKGKRRSKKNIIEL